MGFVISGWVEFVVEVRWVDDPIYELQGGGLPVLQEALHGFTGATFLGSGKEPVIGTHHQGQFECCAWIRVTTTGDVVTHVMDRITQACAAAFPYLDGEARGPSITT